MSSSPTRRAASGGRGSTGGGSPTAVGGTGGGVGVGGSDWEWAVRPSKYTELTHGGGGTSNLHGVEGGVLETGSPLRTNVRTQGLSLNLFMTNDSSASGMGGEEESVDIPSSYIGDDSTISSWPASPRVGINQRTCCNQLSLRYYLSTSLFLSILLFFWSCAIGFVWGAFLSLGAIGTHLMYFYHLLRRVQPPLGARNIQKQRCLHYTVLIFSYLVLFYLLIRLICARNTFVRDDAFPSRCYPNALGTVPPACVRVTDDPLSTGERAHGLSAPTFFTPKTHSVTRLVEKWAGKQFQTKVVGKAGAGGREGETLHLVAVTGFWGFVDDMAVEVACVEGEALVEGNGTVVVRVQSEQRFGTLDGGVNKRRVTSLLKFLEKKAGGLPMGTCSPAPRP